MSRDYIPDATDKIATQVVDAGFQVHQALGPGLLESAYEECLAYELTERGIAHRRQVGMPLFYKGLKLDVGYRIDLLVAFLCRGGSEGDRHAAPNPCRAGDHLSQALGLPRRSIDEFQHQAVQNGRPADSVVTLAQH